MELIHAILWDCIKAHETSFKLIELHASQWICRQAHETPGKPVKILGNLIEPEVTLENLG